LIEAVLKANPKTIIVMMGGGPVDMSKWIDKAPAVLQAWYAGMEGGNALAKILFGAVNPTGKLPMTFPKKLEDVPAHKLGQYPGNGVKVYYNDDIYVGYRYYDTYGVKPQFAFGHGLSYTKFSFSDLSIKRSGKTATVSFRLKNTGKVAGAEVAQVYVKQDKTSLPRPEKELKGFQKVFLKAGESKLVTIQLNEEAFQYYNDLLGKWVMDSGSFQILVGAASDDIKLKGKVIF
jgi:beta-glucosidase